MGAWPLPPACPREATFRKGKSIRNSKTRRRAIGAALTIACIFRTQAIYAVPADNSSFHGSNRAAFLSQGVGARPMGMAGAFIAVADDASAVSWNPAGIGQLQSAAVLTTHNMVAEGVSISHVAGVLPIGFGVAGLGITMLNFGGYDIRDASGSVLGTGKLTGLAGTAAYALATPSWVPGNGWVGGSLEYIHDAAGVSLANVTFGCLVPLHPQVNLAGVLQRMSPKSGGFSQPSLIKLGVTYFPMPQMSTSVDAAFPTTKNRSWIALGAEVRPVSLVALRIGYRRQMTDQQLHGLSGITGGLGLRYGALGVDYAYQPFGDVATTHRVSLTYDVNQKRRTTGTVPTRRRSDAAAEPAVTTARQPTVESAYQSAVDLYGKGDYDGAWGKAHSVLQTNPNHWQAWQMIGNCQYAKGDKTGAIATYRRSLQINPNNPSLQTWVDQLSK